ALGRDSRDDLVHRLRLAVKTPGSSRSCDPMVTESPPASAMLVAGIDGPVPGPKPLSGEPMKMMDEETGEILVLRDPSRSRIEVHIKGTTIDEYRVVRLARREARRLWCFSQARLPPVPEFRYLIAWPRGL